MNEENKKEKVSSLQAVIYTRSSKQGNSNILRKRALSKSKQDRQPKKMAE